MGKEPGYTDVENFKGGVQRYTMEFKDFISNISFNIKNENNQLVSFNGQTLTFRLSIKKF